MRGVYPRSLSYSSLVSSAGEVGGARLSGRSPSWSERIRGVPGAEAECLGTEGGEEGCAGAEFFGEPQEDVLEVKLTKMGAALGVH